MKKKFGLLALTGVIALASCSQGTTPGVSQYKLTINVAGVPTAPVTYVKSGGASQTVNVAGSTTLTLDAGSYTVTPGAVTGFTASPSSTSADLSSSDKTVSFTYVTSSGGGGGGGGGVIIPPSNGAITITSPANGATLTGNAAVSFTTTGTVTNISCGVQGGTFTAANNIGSNGGACAIDLSAVPNGPVTLVVKGTQNGAEVSSTVSVNVARVVSPNASPSFGPIETVDASGRVNFDNFRTGGVRLLAQENIPSGLPNQPAGTGTLLYVKGKIKITYAAPAGTTRVDSWISGTIDGSKAGALFNVFDGAAGTVVDFDTTGLNGVQSKVLYLVTRTYNAAGNTTSSVPFVVDNTGPQASDPDFEAANTSNPAQINRLLRDYGGRNRNFARGQVELFTSNANLSDLVYNPASGQILPAGVDNITYYFVPASQVAQITTITGQQRVLDIRRLAAFGTATVESAGQKRDYRTLIDSTDGSKDGGYAIFSIAIDQIGNETASTTYENLTLDNIGPSAQNVSLYDSSPLPFPSADPRRYISDWFRITGCITYAGVGFASDITPGFDSTSNAALSFCGRSYAISSLGGTYSQGTISFSDQELDSNVVVPSDGECEVTFNAPDALGNVSKFTGQKVIFDNTDPVADIQNPAEGAVVNAGSTVPFNTNASDVTSGINPDYTKTFWNDYVFGQTGRTRPQYIGAPVEFRTDPINSVSNGAITSINGGFTAVYPGQLGTANDPRPLGLNVLVVDKAGNATVKNRRLTSTLVNPFALPSLGDFANYPRNTPPTYLPVPVSDAQHIQLATIFPVFNTTEDFNIEIKVPGTSGRTGDRLIKTVDFFRQLDVASWNDIVKWQTTAYDNGGLVKGFAQGNDPTLLVRAGSDLQDRRIPFGQLTARPNGANDGEAQTRGVAPWFLAGDTVTSSDYYRTTTALRGANAFAGASALAGVVTDTSGMYAAAANLTQVITVQNSTIQSVLDQSYTTGSTVDRFQFIVSTPISLVPSRAPNVNGTYYLQGRTTGGTFETIDDSASRGTVVYTSDTSSESNGGLADLNPGVNQVQAKYTFGTKKYNEFRLVTYAGIEFAGQIFPVKVN